MVIGEVFLYGVGVATLDHSLLDDTYAKIKAQNASYEICVPACICNIGLEDLIFASLRRDSTSYEVGLLTNIIA